MLFIVLSEDARSARELISAARDRGADSIVAVQFDATEAEAVSRSGATKVVVARLADGALKEEVASLVVSEAQTAESATVLVSSSRRMVNAAGRIAQQLGTAPIPDVKSVEEDAFKHMMYGGKIMVGEKPTGPYVVAVVQSAAYEPVDADNDACPIESVDVAASSGAKVVGLKDKEAVSVDLTAAKTIVCIGRGVGTQEGFELCASLKDAVKGEMGCTRPVTETEDPFMPRETYIGASGVIVKPNLYIGVATSGQTQHTMGMYESGKVVVIDKNASSLFFPQCDYGLVGDYHDIVPAITKALGA